MTIKLIVRPSGIITTPRNLKDAFFSTRYSQPMGNVLPRIRSGKKLEQNQYPVPQRGNVFFLSYPRISTEHWSDHGREQYSTARNFFISDKGAQRDILRDLGLPVPRRINPNGDGRNPYTTNTTSEMVYIGRPFTHRSGIGWTIYTGANKIEEIKRQVPEGTNVQLLSRWCPTQEYLCELFQKTHEYRIVLVKGFPLITLLKRVAEPNVYMPWNHSQGSAFVTVTQEENNRLRHTNIYQVIERNQEFLSSFDILGLDVMYNSRSNTYSVCEGNLCPALTIETNTQKVAQYVTQNLR